jgi:TetR/AcrR family transcriptional regulator
MERKSRNSRPRYRERDLNRTRERLIASALHEFSMKGAAGARTESIAKRAKVDQRMIFYWFGNKAGLYREVLRRKLAATASIVESDPFDDFASTLAIGYETARANVDHVRMWQWESLEWGHRKLVAEEERRALLQKETAKIQRAQSRGFLPADIEPQMLLLTRIALSAFPFALPQLARLATGLEPGDQEFHDRWIRCLRSLGERIAPSELTKQDPLQPQMAARSHDAEQVVPAAGSAR